MPRPVFEGHSSQWFRFEDDCKSAFRQTGCTDMVFTANPNQRRKKANIQRPGANATQAQIATFNYDAKQNELFVEQQQNGIKALFALISPHLQRQINTLVGLAEMYDYLANKYKPQRGANNIYSEEQIEAVRAMILVPIGEKDLFEPHWDNIVQLHEQLNNKLPGAYYYVIQDLIQTLSPQDPSGWTRWIEHISMARKLHKTGDDFIKYLKECDERDQNAFAIGKGPSAPPVTTTTSNTTVSSTTTNETDLANVMRVGEGRGGRGRGQEGGRGRGQDNYFRGGRGGRGNFGGRGHQQYNTQQQTGYDKANSRRYSNHHNHNQPYTYDNSGRGYNNFGGRFGRARHDGRGKGRDNKSRDSMEKRIEKLEKELKKKNKQD